MPLVVAPWPPPSAPDAGCTRGELIAALGRRALPAFVPAVERHFFEFFFHPRRATTVAAASGVTCAPNRRRSSAGHARLDDLLSVLFGHLSVTAELARDVDPVRRRRRPRLPPGRMRWELSGSVACVPRRHRAVLAAGVRPLRGVKRANMVG
ncbi:hypothetical protein ACTIVE_8807 [Actinomadura verrucosospora]|uniref:Uncharacterized protein n=1 Tax=Actinomadura verrucosospora TaxID=46165 RepID=A0A7D3W2S7_ACTVE|nr:hypothetical protein ACTIVE_8807 [Actinomadura verrucosospora]